MICVFIMVSYTDRYKVLCDLLIFNKKPRSYVIKRGIYWHVHVSLQHSNTGWNSVNCLYVLVFIITIFD